MEESTRKTIKNLKDWSQLKIFKSNAKKSNRLTAEVESALQVRGSELATIEIFEATGKSIEGLSPAEKRVLEVVKAYVALKREAGSHAAYTLKQIKNRGFLRAAEASVTRPRPTDGFKHLVEADLEDLSYEQIVLDHPLEFTEKALRYARRTLGKDESLATSRTASNKTQIWTENLLAWHRGRAKDNSGIIPMFTNAEAASQIGINDLAKSGRAYGNLQSRIDYACFRLGLPALGLVADAPFAKAWTTRGRSWSFPISKMQSAAKSYVWTEEDFDRVLALTSELPGRSSQLWQSAMSAEEALIRFWAFGDAEDTTPTTPSSVENTRPPNWSRDELILALDLYLRHRESPPNKDSAEVVELSSLLNTLGQLLGVAKVAAFRNPNGVHMKLMNFRRFDPEFTRDGKVGLSRGNKDEEVVWNEFSGDPNRLAEVVAAIRWAVVGGFEATGDADDEDPEAMEAKEGRLLTRIHRSRERNRKIVEQRKKSHLKTHGRLFCEGCGFDFAAAYGVGVEHIIDCHHTKPVHTMVEGDVTRLDDLALLCANCHRVVHAFSPWLSIERLKELLASKRLAE